MSQQLHDTTDSQQHHTPQPRPRSMKPDLPVDRGWAWLIMIAAFVNVLITIVFIRTLAILLSVFLERFEAPAAEVTLAFGLSEVMESLSNLAIPTLLLPRFTVRALTCFGSLCHGLSILALVIVNDTIFLSIVLSIIGLSRGIMLTPSLVHLGSFFKRRLSFANAFAGAGLSVATLGAPLMITYLLEEYGVQGALLILGGLSLHSVPASMLFRPLSMYDIPKEKVELLIPEPENGEVLVLEENISCSNNHDTLSSQAVNAEKFVVHASEDSKNHDQICQAADVVSTDSSDNPTINHVSTSPHHQNNKPISQQQNKTKKDCVFQERDRYRVYQKDKEATCIEKEPLTSNLEHDTVDTKTNTNEKCKNGNNGFISVDFKSSMSTPDLSTTASSHFQQDYDRAYFKSTPAISDTKKDNFSTIEMLDLQCESKALSLSKIPNGISHKADLQSRASKDSTNAPFHKISTSHEESDEDLHASSSQTTPLLHGEVSSHSQSQIRIPVPSSTRQHCRDTNTKDNITSKSNEDFHTKSPKEISISNSNFNSQSLSQTETSPQAASFSEVKITSSTSNGLLNTETISEETDVNSKYPWLQRLKNYVTNSVLIKPLSILVVLAGGVGVNTQGTNTFMPVLGLENGLTPDETPWLLTIAGISDIVGKLSIGFLTDLGYLRPIWVACITQTVVGLLFQFTRFYTSLGLMFSMATISGMTAGILAVMMTPMIIEVVGTEKMATLFSAFFLLSGFVHFIMNVVVGAITDLTGSFVGGYHFVGALMLASVVIMCTEPLVKRFQKSQESTNDSKSESDNK